MPDKPLAPALDRLPASPASLTDQAVAAIREAVRDGTLAPGQLYSAYQIADYLGVSRSPVREALMRLAEAGMVSFERNRGFRIVLPGPRDIAEVFQLRLLLEVPATRQAAASQARAAAPGAQRVAASVTTGLVTGLRAEFDAMRSAAAKHDEPVFMRHDQRLHALIVAATGNSRAVKVVDGLRDLTRLLGSSTVDRSRDLDDILAEHLPILDAIAAGDAQAAGRAMAGHITHTGRLLTAQAVAETGSAISAEDLWSQLAISPSPE
jgi:DNA-binding GntR family transcriptional regulator